MARIHYLKPQVAVQPGIPMMSNLVGVSEPAYSPPVPLVFRIPVFAYRLQASIRIHPQNYYHVPPGHLTHMTYTLLVSDPRMCSAAFRGGVVLANAPLVFRGIVVTGCQLWAATIRANPAIDGEHV